MRAITWDCPIQGGYDTTKYFEARGIGPMRILKDHQHRILACQRLHLTNERVQRLLARCSGGQFERWIAPIVLRVTTSRHAAQHPL
jgi:hypothetical protein